MRSRVATGVALLLVACAVALLFIGDDILLGSAPEGLELENWPHDLEALAGLAALGIALASRPARVPVCAAILLVSAVLAVVGPTDLVSFYDGGGLAAALGFACLVALWLLATGRRSRRTWPYDVSRRLILYLTLGVLLVPGGFLGVAAWSCAGASEEDDLCGLPGLYVGAPAALLAWLILVAAGEMVAAGRRHL